MKVKNCLVSFSSKKNNSLPTTSKLLKPKAFKPNVVDNKKARLDKEKCKLALAKGLEATTQQHSKNELHHVVLPFDKEFKDPHKITADKEYHIKEGSVRKFKPEKSNEITTHLPTMEFNKVMSTFAEPQILMLGNENKTKKAGKINRQKKKWAEKAKNKSKLRLSFGKSKLNPEKVSGAVNGLFKLVNMKSNGKTELLDIEQSIYLQVECIKIPICPKKQLRFKLPHPLVNELSDILLITADKKGAKIYPEKAVEYYTELLAKHDINFIQKVIPVRSIKTEYSQYEMRKKLVDQYDLILSDANITKVMPSLLGKFVCYTHKMPIPVHLNRHNLKDHLKSAISKTQMTVKSNGHMNSVQVGHMKMSAKQITENILEVTRWLAELFPGGWKNIRSLYIKTNSTIPVPLYLSLLSPNMVRIPVEQPKKKPVVEGELSTMPGAKVIVKSDGTVILHKLEENEPTDDLQDDEILQEAEKYMHSAKTVRYDESEDDCKDGGSEDGEDSDKEADAVTAAMEKELLTNYTAAAAKKKTIHEEDEEDEEEDDSDNSLSFIPLTSKKRKRESDKKQPEGKSPKMQKKGPQQKKIKEYNNENSMNKGQLRRGSRGGKKNKMSKDQRKALIKRKKAGKD